MSETQSLTLTGFFLCLSSHPFESLKIHIQLNQASSISTHMKSMLKTAGPSIFFRGLSFPLSSVPLIVWVSTSSQAKLIDRDLKNSTFYEKLVNGAYLSLLTSLISTPAELLKTRVQCEALLPRPAVNLMPSRSKMAVSPSFSPFIYFKSLVATEGINSLFKGVQITAFRDFSTFTVQFSTFELIKHWMVKEFGPQLSFFHVFAAGMAAGVFGSFLSYPCDVVKTHIQAGKSSKVKETCREIWKEFGISGFFKGFSVVFCRSIFTTVFGFLAFQSFLRNFRWSY